MTELVALAAALALGQTVDTSDLSLGGARSEGSIGLPAARLLEPGSFEVSIGYSHIGGAARVTYGTGAVRGPVLTQVVPWVDQRDLGWVQIAVSPAPRFELLTSLPVLFGQSVNQLSGATTPATGAGVGDLHLGLRVALLDRRPFEVQGLQWAIAAGVLAPTGASQAFFGESPTRAEVATTVAWQSGAGWTVTGNVGYRSGQTLQVGDRLYGPAVALGAALAWRLRSLQLSADVLSNVEVGAADEAALRARASLEVLVGLRYLGERFFVDVGGGGAPLDTGTTSQWRVQLAFGARGLFESVARRPEPQPPRDPCVLCGACVPPTRAEVDERAERGPPRYDDEPPAASPERVNPQEARRAFRMASLREQAVFFEVGSSALDANTHAVIRAVARIMLAQPGRVLLSGHTDDSGPDELNEQLATARADAVKALLVEAGIDPGRLSTRGAGRREPISTTAQRFGRSINRTVTFDWVE